MKTFLRLLPAALAALLLGAHFYRARQLVLVAAALAVLALVFVARRRAVRAAQLGLLAGAFEWLRSLLSFAELRAAAGAPWTRLAWILGGVAAFTALAALLLEGRIAALAARGSRLASARAQDPVIP
ncbi:MAG: hypothetical protein AMXMBFR36_33130 [Acidobacteriota bacterium]